MRKVLGRTVSFLILVGIGLNAQAGHLFTQAALNTPINLNAGFGINIPQDGLEGEGSSAASSDSYINVCNFDSGDALRVILPGYTQTFTFGSLPSGWTLYPSTDCQPDGTSPNEDPQYIETTTSTSTVDPALAALNPTPPFQWRIEAVSGSFTLHGFRLRTANGTVDGTNSGTVNQSGVTPSGSATIPVFSPAQLVLLILGLIAVVGARRKFLKGQQA